MERIDYMKICAECLSEDECRRLFDRDRDEMAEGTAVWNQSLEVAYNEYCDNENGDEDDEDGFDYEIAEGYAENMPCDTYGMCAGVSCSHYFQCNG